MERTTENGLLVALRKIDQLSRNWDANKLGPISLQRKRWQRLGEIARAALVDAQATPTAPVE
jgi:hypothetical protein